VELGCGCRPPHAAGPDARPAAVPARLDAGGVSALLRDAGETAGSAHARRLGGRGAHAPRCFAGPQPEMRAAFDEFPLLSAPSPCQRRTSRRAMRPCARVRRLAPLTRTCRRPCGAAAPAAAKMGRRMQRTQLNSWPPTRIGAPSVDSGAGRAPGGAIPHIAASQCPARVPTGGPRAWKLKPRQSVDVEHLAGEVQAGQHRLSMVRKSTSRSATPPQVTNSSLLVLLPCTLNSAAVTWRARRAPPRRAPAQVRPGRRPRRRRAAPTGAGAGRTDSRSPAACALGRAQRGQPGDGLRLGQRRGEMHRNRKTVAAGGQFPGPHADNFSTAGPLSPSWVTSSAPSPRSGSGELHHGVLEGETGQPVQPRVGEAEPEQRGHGRHDGVTERGGDAVPPESRLPPVASSRRSAASDSPVVSSTWKRPEVEAGVDRGGARSRAG